MWHFRENQKDEIIHASHEAEFFDLEENLEAIVREAVQNSMDATSEKNPMVTVRFVYGRTPGDLSSLFSGMEKHLHGVGKLSHDLGSSGFEFLAIEDFETTGLTGSTSKDSIDADNGNFFNFWWFDGSTRKGIEKGGRWGIGKYSFFEASKVKTFWGISVTEPDFHPNLMGRVLLKPHKIENRRFTSDGIYSGINYEPIQQEDTINLFYDSFNLNRGKLPGFSLIIPYPVDSISNSERIAEDILTTVLKHYLYSIVAGKLKVVIDTFFNANYIHFYSIEKENLEIFLKSMLRTDDQYLRYEKLRTIYQKLLSKEPDLTLTFEKEKKFEIDEAAFGSDLNKIKESYSQLGKGIMKIRVQFNIQKDGEPLKTTHIDVGITRDPYFKNEPVHCFRSGINVVDGINSYKSPEGVILLIADDKIAAEFLGDAENPSHTRWNWNSERVKESHYLLPEKIIKSIVKTPQSLISVLSKKIESSDKNILSDVFYVFDSDQGAGRERHSKKPRVKVKESRHILQMERNTDGFSVYAGSNSIDSDFPVHINLKAAYDIAEGNPFTSYRTFDFGFDDDITVNNISGGDILKASENQMEILANDRNFKLTVTGFDPRRDVIVELKAKEVQER